MAAAVVLGAVLVWLGARLSLRPVETSRRMLSFLRRGRTPPEWARVHPEVVRTEARVMGVIVLIVGCAFLALAITMSCARP